MQLIYKYYKFPSKSDAPKYEEWPANVSYVELGTIYNNDAEYDITGTLIKPATAKPGWHVNICYNFTPFINLDFIKQYEINVQTPTVLWLGQEL
jgi:hypothetical protein